MAVFFFFTSRTLEICHYADSKVNSNQDAATVTVTTAFFEDVHIPQWDN